MSDHKERACFNCGSLLHHESNCDAIGFTHSESIEEKKIPQYPMLWAIHEACKKLGH